MSKNQKGNIIRGIIILVMALVMLYIVFTRFAATTY